MIRSSENHGDCQGNGNINPNAHIIQTTQKLTRCPRAEENQGSKPVVY